jgi:hypothetical protein
MGQMVTFMQEMMEEQALSLKLKIKEIIMIEMEY